MANSLCAINYSSIMGYDWGHLCDRNDSISSSSSMLKYKDNNWDSYIDKMCKPRSVFTKLYH